MKLYHWGLIYPKGSERKSEMIYNRPTVAYMLYAKVDMVIRYCPETMNAVVVKCRWSARQDLSLEEALQLMADAEERDRRDKEYAARAFSHDEFGTFWNPVGLEDE